MKRVWVAVVWAGALAGVSGLPVLSHSAEGSARDAGSAHSEGSAQGDGTAPAARPFSLMKLDAEFDQIVAPDAPLQLLGDRFGITEGPVWIRDGATKGTSERRGDSNRASGYLIVSDLTANALYQITDDGKTSVFLDKAGYSGADLNSAGMQSRSGRMHVLMIGPSCANVDAQGRLLWCADNDGAIMRLEPDGSRTVIANSIDGKRFNGPNDLVLLRDGSLYFTDPDFGLRDGAQSPFKQLDFAAVWYLKEGKPSKVLDARELGGAPDGIALSPDEKHLYLTAGPGVMKRYDISADHTLSNGMVFARGPSIGDGLRTDLAGHVYSASGAGPGVVGVWSPAGKLLGTINLPVSGEEPKRQICASNVAFGGADGKDLYISACQAVYKIRLRAAGSVPGVATAVAMSSAAAVDAAKKPSIAGRLGVATAEVTTAPATTAEAITAGPAAATAPTPRTASATTTASTPAAVSATPPDTDWPMFNQSYDAQRFSPLSQINSTNVTQLEEVCRVRVGDLGGFGGSPIVVNGVMFVTFGNSTLALNPIDCGVIWKTLYTPEQAPPAGPSNRGVAYADGKLFRGTGDGRVIALDAKTGQELWRTKAADPTSGEGISAAPLVWDGKVFVGIAGSELGVHGRLFALDAKTGAIAWTFNTVPQGNEFGIDTWKDLSWQTGGGGTWSTVSLDPATGEVFVPVGNPSPDFFLPHRLKHAKIGANLFTNSVVAVNAKNGGLSWYFQATPADDRDLDQAAAPLLFFLADGRSAMAAASKDGYLRVIDRTTHRLLYKAPVTTIRNEGKPVTAKGIESCPGTLGGTQWNGPALDVSQRAIVVGAVDWCSFLERDDSVRYQKGQAFYGGRITSLMDPPPSGWISSFDADTGKLRWKFHAPAPVVAALTPTAGGVTFAGDQLGNFYALKSADGERLLSVATGGSVSGGIITYALGGKQYVAVTSGNVSRTMWVTTGLPHIVIYALPGDPPDPVRAASGRDVRVERGAGVFVRTCAACHGFGGVGGTGPALKGVGKRLTAEELAGQIRAPRKTSSGAGATMPPFDTRVIPEQSLRDVVAFLETL